MATENTTITELEMAACTILAAAPAVTTYLSPNNPASRILTRYDPALDTDPGFARAARAYVRSVISDPEFNEQPGAWLGELLDADPEYLPSDDEASRDWIAYQFYSLVAASRLAVEITRYRRDGRAGSEYDTHIGSVAVVTTSLAAGLADYVATAIRNNGAALR